MRLAAPLALAALVLAPRGALAFCRTASCDDGTGARCIPAQADDCGVPLWWPTTCTQMTLAQAGSSQISAEAALGVAAQAFGAWTEVDCGGAGPSVSVQVGPLVACDQHEYNENGNANVLAFRDDGWPYDGASSILALTTVTYDVATGKILDADLEVNSAEVAFTTGDQGVKTDLLSVLTHEAGHFFGLAHSTVPGATMIAEYVPGDLQPRTLEADDAAAICAAYPIGDPRDRPCDTTPPGGFSAACHDPNAAGCGCAVPGGGGGRGAAGLAAAALAAGALRRSRSRRVG